MKLKRFRLALLLALSLSLLAPLSVNAQLGGEELPPGVTEDDVYRVSSELYCDVCAGIPLSTCPSTTCFRWRQEIANLLGEGRSDAEVYAYFAENYGDEVTGVPLESGGRNLALGLPALLALLLGVAVVWRLWSVQQSQQNRAVQAAQSAGLHEDYQRPVPDNVDPQGLEAFMQIVEAQQ